MARARHPAHKGAEAGDDGVVTPLHVPVMGTRQWTFDNGLELIVHEDGGAPLASLQAWCRTGSIHEGKWLGGGLSHLLEHMLFKGTERRGSNEIAQDVQDVGGYFNAYTSFERTVYWIDVPSDGFKTGLDILCDIVTSATLPGEELGKEQDVIRREIEMGQDDPDQCLSRQMFSTAYAVHPYRFPVIGHLDIFNRVARPDLEEFYRAHYVPDNMFIVVAGDVDGAAVREKVAASFEGVERGATPPAFIAEEPRQLGRRDSHREFATQLSRNSLAWHIPNVTHPDVPALDVLATVLGSGRSSRLSAALREREKLVHAVHAYAYTPAHGGLFSAGTVVDPEKRQRAEERILEIVADIAREGIAPDELEKARKIVTSDQLHSLTTTRGRASDLGSSWLLARNLEFSTDYLASVGKVTLEDVQRVARAYLREDNMTATSLNPKGTTVAKAAKPKSGGRYPIEKHVLNNGLTLLVREDARLPLVNIEACFRGGLLSETAATNGSVRLFAKTLVKGTEKSSAEELAERVESVGGNLNSSSGRNSFTVSLDVLEPDLELAFGMLGEILIKPAFPGGEMEREREAQLAAIKAAEDQPFSVASSLLRQSLYSGSPYSWDVLGTRDSLNSLGREILLDHQGRLLAGRNGVVAVFGAVDAGRVVEALEEKLGALPEGKQAFAGNAEGRRGEITESIEVSESMDKSQAVVMAGFAACNIFHEDRLALEILDEACSDLSSRLFIRIREEMGLAYMVGSSFGCGFDPGGFVVYAGTAPDKAAEVREALLEEIANLSRDGLTEVELKRAKRTYLGKMLMQRQSNAGLADAVALDELYGLGWDNGETQRGLIENLKLKEVNQVIGSYFGDRHRVVVTVSPTPEL